MKYLSALDQKILLGVVSRAPNKYTDLFDENRKGIKIDDSDSSSEDSDPDLKEIAHKRRQKEKEIRKIKDKSSSN